MWQPPSAGTVAACLGVGQRFLPGQAARKPMVAPVALQLDVWSLQRIDYWQQLPFLLLHRPQPASDHQPLVHHMPGYSRSD